MSNTIRFRILAFSFLLALAFSAVLPGAAFADEGDPPATEEPAPPPDDGSGGDETAPAEGEEWMTTESGENPATETSDESTAPTEQPASTDEAASETSEILEALPQDTDIVVLDENGNVLPLASTEADETISGADPIWCPSSIGTPVAGPGVWVGGCSPSFLTFNDLITWLSANDPNVAGTIWFEKGYDSGTFQGAATTQDSGDSLFELNGLSFANLDLFALTIKGGWNGLGTNTIDISDKSEFNGSLWIHNWQNSITINDILITGATGFDSLRVSTSTGNVALNRVTIQANNPGASNFGARITNSSATGTVVLSNTTTNNPTSGSGLQVTANGNITLTNVVANGNALLGAYLTNSAGTGNVSITGSTFNSNGGVGGLDVDSAGTITLTNVKANSNTLGYGANLDNTFAVLAKNVTVTATTSNHNEFNSNRTYGLQILSKGVVSVKDITASNNGQGGISGSGLIINNTFLGSGTQAVTFTGTNLFNDNIDDGLWITSRGAITLNNIFANDNGNASGDYGAHLDNEIFGVTSAITLNGTNQFKFNYDDNLLIRSNGLITLNNVSANSSETEDGADISNLGGTAGVTIKGTNYFIDNDEEGLLISTNGAISLNNITASYNGTSGGGSGATLINDAATMPGVTITGTNFFNGNGDYGLWLVTNGTVSLNSITASYNVNYGAYVNNSWDGFTASKKGIKLTGTNAFIDNEQAGLAVYSYGAVTISSITANLNGFSGGYDGVWIDNCLPVWTGSEYVCATTTAQAVTITGGQFIGNSDSGLQVISRGAIKVTNITASGNGFGSGSDHTGMFLDNCYWYTDGGGNDVCAVTSPASVTVAGTNVFNGNDSSGVRIYSRGAITLSNVTANDSDNSSHGADLRNDWFGMELAPQNVTLSGTNTFNGNSSVGLSILSFGAITLSSVTATDNSSYGAWLDNCRLSFTTNLCRALTPKTISITTAGVFNDNSLGLLIDSRGAVSLKNITAKDNSSNGINIDNCQVYDSDPTATDLYVCAVTGQNVTFTGTSLFTGNYYGLEIYSGGAVSLSSINSSSNDGYGIFIDNCLVYDTDPGGSYVPACAVTSPRTVTLTGTNVASSNVNYDGLYVSSAGAITVNSLTANANGLSSWGYGAYLNNSLATSAQAVKFTGTSSFIGNKGDGLYVLATGVVTLNNVTSTDSTDSGGVAINNKYLGPVSPQNVSITGTNNFSDNYATGLSVLSLGTISLNNVTASNNGVSSSYNGAALNNCNEVWDGSAYYCDVITPKGIVFTGTNTFNNNRYRGVDIWTSGAVTSSTSLTANYNGQGSFGEGVYIENSDTNAVGGVSLLGTNKFIGNAYSGLWIYSRGTITLASVTAEDNGNVGTYGYGVYADNCDYDSGCQGTGNAVLTGTSKFANNFYSGLYVHTVGTITASNLSASENGGYGVYLYNGYVEGKAVILTGLNGFSANEDHGLYIYSLSAVTLNSLTATGNGTDGSGGGVFIDNDDATVAEPAVKITGTSVFNDNNDWGLEIYSQGVITLNNITASYNGSGGAYLQNSGGSGTGVTLTGTNNFNYNVGHGLDISSIGAVSISKITADGNGVNGLAISGSATTVTITCGWFTGNTNSGLSVSASTGITLKGVISAGNGSLDSFSLTPVVVRSCP